MARSALTGTRVRERRLLISLKQADLARMAGISPAYLNLIEHNRRRVGAELLTRLADALGVEETALAEGAESALFDGLREAAAGRGAGDAEPELARIEEFVSRFPGWAALVAAQRGRIAGLERAVEALHERMAHDPFLSASLHEVVSAVTSLRSTAAILAESEEMEPDWRARFHRNVYEDSVRLSEAAAALVAYLDTSQEAETGLSSPQEEVEAWLAAGRTTTWLPLERTNPPAPESLIAGVPELASGAARQLALAHIDRYRTDAAALPLDRFVAALEETGPDPAAPCPEARRRARPGLPPLRHPARRDGPAGRACGLRCLGHAELPSPRTRFRAAPSRCGLSALAALRGTGAPDGADPRGRGNGRTCAAALHHLCLFRTQLSRRLRRTPGG